MSEIGHINGYTLETAFAEMTRLRQQLEASQRQAEYYRQETHRWKEALQKCEGENEASQRRESAMRDGFDKIIEFVNQGRVDGYLDLRSIIGFVKDIKDGIADSDAGKDFVPKSEVDWNGAANQTAIQRGVECDRMRDDLIERTRERNALKSEVEALHKQLEDKIAGVLSIRCSKHYTIPQLNKNEHGGGECGACIAEEVEALIGPTVELLEYIKEQVTTEVAAYGNCSCDVPTGDTPCPYCASIHANDAIEAALARLKSITGKEGK